MSEANRRGAAKLLASGIWAGAEEVGAMVHASGSLSEVRSGSLSGGLSGAERKPERRRCNPTSNSDISNVKKTVRGGASRSRA